MINFTTNSPEETVRFGKQLSKLLPKQAIIALCGELGSGKTTLVKGIAQGIGINSQNVNSPSYVLIKEYKNKGRNLFHCDLYRLESAREIAFLGIEDYYAQKGLFIIEWAQKAKALLPDEYLQIKIKPLSVRRRRFNFSAKGNIHKKVADKIKAMIQNK